MAEVARLSVRVDANLSPLQRGLTKTQAQLRQTSRTASTTGTAYTRLARNARAGATGMTAAGAAARRSTRSFVTMSAAAGKVRTGLVAAGSAAKSAGAFLGIAGLAGATKVMIDEAREAGKVTRQTAAVLKSTGGAANVSAKQVAALSSAISLKSGMDDEAIQKGANLLLTFTKIRDETGRAETRFSRRPRGRSPTCRPRSIRALSRARSKSARRSKTR